MRTVQRYTIADAVADWLAEGLPGRTVKTVEVNRDSSRPLLAVIGTIPLKALTVLDVRTALKKMAATHATPALQRPHNCMTRALRHAEGQDLVRRARAAAACSVGGLACMIRSFGSCAGAPSDSFSGIGRGAGRWALSRRQIKRRARRLVRRHGLEAVTRRAL